MELISKGVEIWIVTSRWRNKNDYENKFERTGRLSFNSDLFEVTDFLEIPRDRILFTNGEEKWKGIKGKEFLFHIDDDWKESELINKKTESRGIPSRGNPSWRDQADKELRNGKKE